MKKTEKKPEENPFELDLEHIGNIESKGKKQNV